MKILRWSVAWAMIAAVGWAAEDSFSKAVRPGDFSAAGLSKLTPEELARLDALVRDFKSGALEAAKREATAAAEARVKAEAAVARAEAAARVEAERAAKAEAKARVAETQKAPEKADAGLLKRAKVLLTPGTKIEYTTVDAKLVGEFRGWQPKMIFTLDNGQRWQVIGGDSYVVAAEREPKVKIVPGALGAFFMHVEGHRQRAKVAILDDGK